MFEKIEQQLSKYKIIQNSRTRNEKNVNRS